MKKNLLIISIAFVTILSFSGCAIHSGFMSDSASLSANNFKMIRYAEGTASTTKFFGLGGLAKNALVAEAKKDLIQNNPLKDGQALANVTVDFKNSYIFFVVTTKVTVTADIVEFKELVANQN
jgi:hypothetical protein